MQKKAGTSSQLLTAVLAACLLSGCDLGVGSDEQALALEVPVLRTAVQIADPHRARFPENTITQGFARSIWDLHTFEGRIYVGGGDSWNNTGGMEVWSLGDDGAVTDLRLETVVDDEQVALFRDYGGRLFIPGNDATESWDLGNFYVKQGGLWQKRRTIPGALHVHDLALFQGRLYVYIVNIHGESLLESRDDGTSWRPLGRKPMGGALTPFEDTMLMQGACSPKGCATLIGAGKAQSLRVPVPTYVAARTTRFGAGALYTDTNIYLPYVDYQPPLVYLGVPAGPYVRINEFRDRWSSGMRDVVVEGQTAYALTAARHPTDPSAYVGYIFSSTDLAQWTRIAEFTVPAPPYSFARLDGRFYVGLGADRMYDDPAATPQLSSGTIWRLE